MLVATAGAPGLVRTTAQVSSPGQLQPRPKASAAPDNQRRQPRRGEQDGAERADAQRDGDRDRDPRLVSGLIGYAMKRLGFPMARWCSAW